ncbi:hypothetical protein G7054_g2486 [Neopestalotiopsis clavispora]|nr:hypothetical protein G7054_g2486 [Neopestalotiopsis clavispora]
MAPTYVPQEVDLVVVGAGFAGLVAAFNAQEAGLRAVLLEAKSRVGGRSFSFPLASGGITEYGATWINKDLQPQHRGGDAIFEDHNGVVSRVEDDGGFGPLPDATLQKLGQLVQLMHDEAEKLKTQRWCDTPKDQDMSFLDWALKAGLHGDPFIEALVGHYASGCSGCAPDQVSAQFVFNWVRSCISLECISNDDAKGAQSLKLQEGTSSIAVALGKALTPGSLQINAPVRSIVQEKESHCLVTTESGSLFKARKVILAIPLAAYDRIQLTPPLPHSKRVVIPKIRAGYFTKVILTYHRPWWREAGLVGKFSSFKGPIAASYDASGFQGSHYTLTLYLMGENAAPWHEIRDDIYRQELAIEHLVKMVGPELAAEARDVSEYHHFIWTDEEYINEGPILGFGPGEVSNYGPNFCVPFKNIHFAGSDLSEVWIGYLEGAVDSGRKAANEVISELVRR